MRPWLRLVSVSHRGCNCWRWMWAPRWIEQPPVPLAGSSSPPGHAHQPPALPSTLTGLLAFLWLFLLLCPVLHKLLIMLAVNNSFKCKSSSTRVALRCKKEQLLHLPWLSAGGIEGRAGTVPPGIADHWCCSIRARAPHRGHSPHVELSKVLSLRVTQQSVV